MQPNNAWHDRLGWAFDLIANDVSDRHRAHRRLLRTQEQVHEALRRCNQIWKQPEHPEYQERHDAWHETQQNTLPHALWSYDSPRTLATWDGLPYALLYLRWEALFPDEWYMIGKSWGTKSSLLQLFISGRRDLPANVVDDLIDLVILAVRREYRCEDVGYARLARALDTSKLRTLLTTIADQPVEPAQLHARYVLWLLNHPDAPRPKRSQWLSWLSGQGA